MAEPEAKRATTRDWIGLAVLVLPCFVVSMDGHVLNLAVPKIAADLRPSAAQLLWIIDGYVFFVGGALLAMGVIGDRIGRRRLLLTGIVLFSGGSLAAAFARTPGELILGRVLMGLAGASLMPSTLALIRGMFHDRRQRTAALGVWSASFSLGGLMGPLVGGALLDRYWWGSVFLLALPVALLLLVVGPLVLPEFRDPNAAKFDVLGAVQSLLALLAIVYAIKSVAAQGSLLEAGLATLFGLVLGAAFIRRQRRAATPMIDPDLFRSRAVRVALVSSTLTFFALYGTNVGLAQYLQWVIGLTPLQAGLWTIPSVLAYLAGTALGPPAVSRFSRVRVLAVGLLISAIGCGLFVAVLVGAFNNLAVIVAATVTFALGLAPVYTMSTDLIVANTRPERAGAASAVAETGAELGGAMGIALLGSLGVTIYRTAMTPTAGLSPDAIDDTRRSLSEAVTVARTLPSQQGQELMQHARSAFEVAIAAMGGAASIVILSALTSITVITVRARRAKHPEPATEPATEATTSPEPATQAAVTDSLPVTIQTPPSELRTPA